MLTIKEKMGIAKRYTRYFDTQIYVDFLDAKPTEMPKLRFSESRESFTDHRNIQIGLDMIPADTEDELIWKIGYILGHELQHIHSTTQRDWEAGLDIGTNEVFNRAYQKVFGKSPIAIVRIGSVEKIAKALEDTDTPLSLGQVQAFVHYIMNSLEDGRIEQIRSQSNQQFAKEMKAFRAEAYEKANLDHYLGDEEKLPDNPDDLNAVQRLEILLNQVLSLSTSQVYQKGFLRNYGNTSMLKKLNTLKPSIKAGVASKTCRKCMEQADKIVELLSDDIIEASKESAFERFMRQLIEAMKSAEQMRPSATSHDEQQGSGQMSSVFNISDLDDDKDDDGEDQNGEQKTGDGEKGSEDQNGYTTSDTSESEKGLAQDGDGNGSSNDNDGNNSSGNGQGSNDEPGEGENTKSSNSSGSGEPSSQGANPSSGSGANAVSTQDEDGTETEDRENGDAHDTAVSEKVAEAAAESEKTTGNVVDEAKLAKATEEEFKKRMRNFKGVPLQQIDLSEIDKNYKDDQCNHFEENERTYQPDLLPPFSLQNKGNALKRKIKNIFKARKQPNQRAMRSGRVDSSRLTSLIFSDPAIFAREGEERDPEAAIYLLQDNSGSMGDGERSKRYMCCDAITIVETALADFFPLKITAYDTAFDTVRHICVKSFDEKGPNFSYNFRQQAMSGRGNKDGFSIRVATQELMTRHEQDRILIIASDGMPSNYSGGMQSGVVDTHNAIAEARAKGITVIGMFLTDPYTQDEEVEHFKYMYDNRFAFIVNMDSFADKLSDTLRKAIAHLK